MLPYGSFHFTSKAHFHLFFLKVSTYISSKSGMLQS